MNDRSASRIGVEVRVSEAPDLPGGLQVRLQRTSDAAADLTTKVVNQNYVTPFVNVVWNSGFGTWQVVDVWGIGEAAHALGAYTGWVQSAIGGAVRFAGEPLGPPFATVAGAFASVLDVPYQRVASMATTILDVCGVFVGALFGLHPLSVACTQRLTRSLAVRETSRMILEGFSNRVGEANTPRVPDVPKPVVPEPDVVPKRDPRREVLRVREH